MPPKSSSSKLKVRINNKSGISNSGVKDVKNILVLTLNNLKSNIVHLNKDVIFNISWMDITQESSPFKIKNSNDQLDESIIINLNLNFMFNIETSFTQTYLTSIINNPILITLSESFAGRSSVVRPGGRMGEMLGQCCWDILPLFTERGLVTPENQEAPIEDQENTSRGEAALETVPEKYERLSNRSDLKSADSIKKAKDSEIRAELTLEPMDDAVDFIHKMKVTVSATLYLESPIPEELNSTNILSLTVESIYNLPPPLCKPEFEFQSLRYCLGITLPLDMQSSEITSRSIEETNIDPRRSYQGLSNTLIFPNGHATKEPDKNFLAKWKKIDDMTKGRAKYTSHPVPGHTEDVKYSETLRLNLEGNNHVQWNQTYRVWLTARMEHKLRQHLEIYGMWPIELKIEAPERKSPSKTGLKSLKHSRIDTKSTTVQEKHDHSKKNIISFALEQLISLPIHKLALLDTSDFIYPGLIQSRILATFLPDLSAEILKMKTGMDKFIFFNVELNQMSSSSDTKIKSLNKTGNLDNDSDPEKLSKGNMTLRDNVPDNLFCIIIHVKFARPLTEKPNDETFLLELYNVTKTLCGPKTSRDVTKEISEYFEKVIAVVSRIFQTEYENFMKLRKRVETPNCNNTIEKTIAREHKQQPGQFLSTGLTNGSGSILKNGSQTVIHSVPQKQKSIVADFKEHLMLSGVLSKAFSIFERPMRDYISFHYEPDGHTEDQDGEYTTLFCMERLADIHAQVTGLMSKIVEKVTNSSSLQDSREGCSSTKASFLAKQLSYAIQYQEEGYVKDAERLLVSRIHTDQRLNLSNAQVWEDYGRFFLGEDRLEESRDNLIRGLHIETHKETLMMLGYVSYRLKQWEKVDLYFSALTSLFETSVEAWTTLGIYYLTVGKHKEAVTVLHIAQMQLTNANKGETDSPVTSGFKNNFNSEMQRNGTSKPLNFSKDNLHFVLNDWKASLDSELSWLDPTPYCFLEETFSSTILIKSCPRFLTLNMFEFAETCINAHRLKINKSSALATYYAAVSQYKQRNFSASLSHLHNVPTPLSKCLPVLVLKFHCASAMNAAQLVKYYNVPSEMKNKHNHVSSIGSNKDNDINCINGKFSKTITMSKNLMGGLSGPSVGNMHQEKPHSMTDNGGLKHARVGWNLTPSFADCRQYYSTMKWEVEAYKRLKWFVLTRLGRMSTEEEGKSEMSGKLLQEAEQYLLRVLQHQKTPLNWYFLGLVYLKQENLPNAEVSFTEANNLDPEFGNVWACLSLVNFKIRNLAQFKNCMIQARKYGADQSLMKRLESLAPFVS